MPSWMQHQIFSPLFLLQLLNLSWYYLMIKILIRLDFFIYTYLLLTCILGLYARLILMTIDRTTRAKMTNKTELYCSPLKDLDSTASFIYDILLVTTNISHSTLDFCCRNSLIFKSTYFFSSKDLQLELPCQEIQILCEPLVYYLIMLP